MEDRKIAVTAIFLALMLGIAMIFGFVNYGSDAGLWEENSEDHQEFDQRLISLEAPVALQNVSSNDEVVELVEETEVCIAPSQYTWSKSDYEDCMDEVTALELALESVEDELNEAVYAALLAYNITIEDEDHITEISYEWDVDGNEVEFEHVKVYGYIDDDEDEDFKVRLEDFTVEVLDLDFDDDYDDASANEDYLANLQVRKLY